MIGTSPVASFPVGGFLKFNVAAQELQIFVNDVDLAGNLFISSSGDAGFTVSEIINGTSTLDLQLVETSATSGPTLNLKVGHEVIVEHASGRLFGGTIEDIKRTSPDLEKTVYHSLTCTDFSACLERRFVAASFEDTGSPITQTLGDVVTLIHAQFLSDGCVFLGTVEDGPLVQKINFNYVRVSEALTDLSRLSGGTFIWNVDYYNNLTFRSRTALTAPYVLSDTNQPIEAIDFSESRETYRNRQIVRGGKTVTESRVEEFEADGKIRTFTVSLPVNAKPVIKVNTVEVAQANIGIKGVDDDTALWVFQLESADISVGKSQSPPSSGDDIEITYFGQFPVAVIREDVTEITARAAIEPGDGVYEAIDVDQELDLPGARAKGDALLDKYARIPARISYRTKRADKLTAGMIQRIDLTVLNIADDFLIDTVTISLYDLEPQYVVAATEGREVLEWLEYLREHFGKPFILRDNEGLLIPALITEQVNLTDTPVIVQSDQIKPFTGDPYTVVLIDPIGNIGKIQTSGVAGIGGFFTSDVDGPHIGPAKHIGIKNGLIVYYKCDETSGTRVDAHTNSLDMAQTGFVGSATGILNLAVDGTGNIANRLDRAHTSVLNIGNNPATITFWGRINTGEQFSNNPMLSKHNSFSGANERGFICWHRSSTNRWRFTVSDDGVGTNTAFVDSLAAPALDTFEFVVCQHDPDADLIKISVNNGAFQTIAFSFGVNPSSLALPMLGGVRVSSEIVALGYTDEVGFWNRLLTTAEITELYGGGTPPSFDTF